MAMRNIVQDGDSILKKKSRPVTQFDAKLAQLLDDMGETMLHADGLGLAGPQVGVLRRVFVAVDVGQEEARDAEEAAGEGETEPVRVLEFVNPEIVEEDGENFGYEGCLSFPGRYGAVKRPQRVKVRAYNRSGQPFVLEGEGLMARCLCHEINHLDGITFDTLSEYFYDPETPHELDSTIGGGADDED